MYKRQGGEGWWIKIFVCKEGRVVVFVVDFGLYMMSDGGASGLVQATVVGDYVCQGCG